MATPRKLSRAQSMEFMKLRANGATYTQLAEKFGIGTATVYRYIKYPTWDDEKKPFEYKPCGTSAAYQRHLSNGERACLACCEAESQRKKDASPYRPRPPRAECGTSGAAVRHRKLNQPLCEPCKIAERAAAKARRKARRKRMRHGTTLGELYHRKRKEKLCELCLESYRKRRNKRKEAE